MDAYAQAISNLIKEQQAIIGPVALEEQLKKAHTSIKVALAKITKGTYGRCEKCGKQIEEGRLLAMPTAQYCVKCSQKASKQVRSADRKSTRLNSSHSAKSRMPSSA